MGDGKRFRFGLAMASSLVALLALAGCASADGAADAPVDAPAAATPTEVPTPTQVPPTPTQVPPTPTPAPTAVPLTPERSVSAVQARLTSLVDRLSVTETDLYFFSVALLDHLEAFCSDQRAVMPLLAGQCYVVGPGIDQVTGVGLEPNDDGIWYVWTDGDAVRVSTAAPPEFLDRISGDEYSRRLEADLQASGSTSLLELRARCSWVLATDGIMIKAQDAFVGLSEFSEQLKTTPAIPTNEYKEFRALFQGVGLRLVGAPPVEDADWAAAASGFFQQVDQALATLIFGWEAGNANSLSLGASLQSDAENRLQTALEHGGRYSGYRSGCESWLGIVAQ
ncbi:MAG: hypothetical protein O3B65_02470 [Chloroflexi bacterium]|nr:hypothetical protein [Chloroflexota bacterium]